jgi:hypothetical protein
MLSKSEIKKYLLIAIGLLLLSYLSVKNQNKSGSCCPLSLRQNDISDEVNK